MRRSNKSLAWGGLLTAVAWALALMGAREGAYTFIALAGFKLFHAMEDREDEKEAQQ